MNPKVLRRFIFFMVLLTFAGFLSWELFGNFFRQEPGDYYTKRGDQFLTSKEYDAALEQFDLALEEMPNHRGALMGRALVHLQTERYDDAIAEFDHLIAFLNANAAPDDPTGIGVLAAAHANRGIVLDRQGRYEEALDAYVEALKIDEGAIEGPGVVHQILYGSERVSSVRDRAVYIYEQLQKPEEERLMRVPELDAKQRMYKP